MKKVQCLFAVLALSLFGCNDDTIKEEAKPIKKEVPKKTEEPNEPGKDPTYQVVWADEFNYEGLPDESKWGYEEGFVRNKEEQYYTVKRLENTRVHDGYLEIKAVKEEYPNKFYKKEKGELIGNKWNIPNAHYTSASINTKDKFNVKYGKIEMRAKLPKGKGVWPAFWLLGADYPKVGWPKCGEIDVMEHIGIESDKVIATVHFFDYEQKTNASIGEVATLSSDDFHLYAVEWNEEKIEFFLDNVSYLSIPIEGDSKEAETFRKDYYILLNFAVGGYFGKNKLEIDNEIFPQSYLIDYVRVYKKK